jgi:6-phosphogluconolactonase/glucosamine-6-phosphate isomerase/deaminase
MKKGNPQMKIIVTKEYSALSLCAADLVEQEIRRKPDALVSFPGGDTPVGMLELFVQRVRSGEIDPSALKFVQLDDWVGIGPRDEGSCSHFIRTKLLEPMGKPFADTFLFDGSAPDIDAQLRRQDAFIRSCGAIDVEVLGIGMNGHLGFNENGVDFSLRSHRNPPSAPSPGRSRRNTSADGTCL